MKLFNYINEVVRSNNEVIINKEAVINSQNCIIAGLLSQEDKKLLYVFANRKDAQPISDDFEEREDKILGGSYFLPSAMADDGNSILNDNEIEYDTSKNAYDENTIADFDDIDDTYDSCDKTNRDQKLENIYDGTDSFIINSMTIQNQRMTFSSSQTTYFNENEHLCFFVLQHFIEKGVDLSSLDKYDSSDIYISIYEQADEELFPVIDTKKLLTISIETSDKSIEYLINQELTLSIKSYEAGNMQKAHIEALDKNFSYYINKVEHYDLWKESMKRFESEQMLKFFKDDNINDEQIEQMKNASLEINKAYCSEDMDLAMLEYEAEDGITLNFYSKAYLDSPIKHNNSGTCGFIMFKSDERIGQNGLNNHACPVGAIAKDYYGSLDVELFSCHIRVPGEIIAIN